MTDRERSHRDNVPTARRLRRPLMPSEQLLWEHLRNRRFEGFKFRRQHPIGPFVLDFYCEELRLACEVYGGVHDVPEQIRHDAERQALIEELGIRFIRIPADEIERHLDAAIEALRTHIQNTDGT